MSEKVSGVGEITMDKEWVMLIKEAQEMGLTVEEVRTYLLTYPLVTAE